APAPAPAAEAAPAAFDAAAFAGTFRGTLPCADCSGIDTQLALKADGSYALDESYQGKKDGAFKGDGTWTAEDNGKRVRLDPNSKSENDRLFEIVSKDEIRMLDTEGKKIDSQLDYSLKRAAGQ
ncbi:copper resistance protein NlpE, partial [Lysobacter enzymogenes]|uniref:copper resistance protein NlpE n=1 Tax=Lysobacter enzymogenes TaxID=69 RepID=UPI0019D119A6